MLSITPLTAPDTPENVFPSALDTYVATADSSYSYTLADTIIGVGYKGYVYNMVSQTWNPSNQVIDHSEWQHWLQIVVPDNADPAVKTAFMAISGGSTRTTSPGIDDLALSIALATQNVVVNIPTIPNEPLQFVDEPYNHTEDAIVAYTFDKFLDTYSTSVDTADDWPSYLAMVNSAVRAMDTVQAVIPELTNNRLQIDDFVVAGGSKRGWTTELTTAVDPKGRVKAMIPIVADLPNLAKQIEYHREFYRAVTDEILIDSHGDRYSQEMEDYVHYDVFSRLETTEGEALLQIVDPFAYRERANMDVPKYFVNGTDDQFFVPGSAEFYIHAMQDLDVNGSTYLRYVPNVGHAVDSDPSAIESILNFYTALVAGDPLPTYDWTIEDDGNTIRLHTDDAPVQVLLWQATNPIDRDFRLYDNPADVSPTPVWVNSVLTDQGNGDYVAHVSTPPSGATGFLIELQYNVGGRPIKFSSSVSVVSAAVVAPELVAVIPNAGDLLNDGDVFHVAPRELLLRFNQGQQIDATTLSAIQFYRAGGAGTIGDGDDVLVPLGYAGLGDNGNEVIVRFAESLPDDLYQLRIRGSGVDPLTNLEGEAFHNGEDLTLGFELDLGAQITAVVPQPISRDGSGVLSQARNKIEIYFNDDDLDPVAAQNTSFYQLIFTNDTATPDDDAIHYPQSVSYDATTDKAVLTFDQDLAAYGTGAFRLRVGDRYDQTVTTQITPATDPGSSFYRAVNLPTLNGKSANGLDLAAESMIVSADIQTVPEEYYLMEYPGAVDEPGQRDLPAFPAILVEDHYLTGESSPDSDVHITTYTYNFADVYGYDGTGAPLLNLITGAQKDRVREVFSLYAYYLGAEFVETDKDAPADFLIATGDIKAFGLTSAPGGIAGVAGGALAVMDAAEDWGSSELGGAYFSVAMHEVGHLLGLGHAYDLPPGTIMGGSEDADNPTGSAEPVFPGDYDIVHGQHIYRPDSVDIDMYKLTLETEGTFHAEIFAQRQNDSSLLNSNLKLYEQYTQQVDGQNLVSYRLVAQNDDYFSNDSTMELYLPAGTYFVGVSASGNDQYDPNNDNTGIGGVTEGPYDLRLTFSPSGVDPDNVQSFVGDGSDQLVDADRKILFDGDADGVPGGVYSFWFNVQAEANTIYVDKAATEVSGYNSQLEDGTLARPYTLIQSALATAQPDDIVRIVGNHFSNDNPASPSSLLDNKPYEIGYDSLGYELADGPTMEIPQGVTVMIDAGAVFKLRKANLDVGSSTEGIDRSRGALQVLGVPDVPVYFTSHFDETLGADSETGRNTVAAEGDWGGLVFRNELDYDFIRDYDPASGMIAREVLETQGIFLNYVNHADIRYGGGEVEVDGLKSVYAPVHLIESRPTVTHNSITNSADGAISADPNSFEETIFENWSHVAPFTTDYRRVGPDVHGNTVVDNSVNGMFVRVRTAPGQPIHELEVPGRFDDWDIVHVVSEVLFINGVPGGPMLTQRTNSLGLSGSNYISAIAAGGPDPDTRNIQDQDTFSLFDGNTRVAFEFELATEGGGYTPGRVPLVYHWGDSAATIAATIAQAINDAHDNLGLDVHAQVINGSVVELNYSGPTLELEGFGTQDARLDGRLAVDPGLIVKMDSSRIEAEIGSQFIAEGRPGTTDGAQGYKVVFTSLLDQRYGAGGTFNTSENTSGETAAPGDWGGLTFSPAAQASIDQAVIAYAGGPTAIEGGFASFDPIEVRQARVRVSNTRFEDNTGGGAGGDRDGRGFVVPATIFVRGAQPVLVDNDFITHAQFASAAANVPVISVDANSMKATTVSDWGRSTGRVSAYSQYDGNHGPLVRGNRMSDNGINGMEVRTGVLTTEAIWDDTDIAHVLRGEIVVSNYEHGGGLRLESSPSESLVVKLSGTTAGFTALGRPLEIDDRIGGTLQVVGTPGHPVVLTSLSDDTVAAGFDLKDRPLYDTNNDGTSVGTAGSWRSVKFERYSNDRNVAIINELEQTTGVDTDVNGRPSSAQPIGQLAPEEMAGDDNLRLGFDIHGTIRYDAADDVDVYTFDATAGTEIWLDIDRTKYALDAIIELVDASGKVLARSDNSVAEDRVAVDISKTSPLLYQQLPVQTVKVMDEDPFMRSSSALLETGFDFFSTNARDAGMRLVLPGSPNEVRTYYVRVRSALAIGNISAGSAIADGAKFTVTSGGSNPITRTFEFNKTGGVSSGAVAISIQDTDTPEQVAGKIASAINNTMAALSPAVTARLRAEGGNLSVVLDGPGAHFNPLDSGLVNLAKPVGEYELQLRLREMQEVAGSTVRYADIRYATNGVEVLGQPGHSPLLGETAEVEQPGQQGSNDTTATAQPVGNLLASDRASLSWRGYLTSSADVDWFQLTLDHEGIQSIGGINDAGSVWATVFDIDYADGMARPDLTLWVFDSQGRLVLIGTDSNIADDQPDPIAGASVADLSRGSVGPLDPFVGSVYMPEKATYYVAVTSAVAIPDALDPLLNPLTRLEPVDSVNRIVEEHVEDVSPDGISSPDFQVPVSDELRLTLTPNAYQLGDVVTYVITGRDLYTIDPFTGAVETDVTDVTGELLEHNDVAMRNDGRLYTVNQISANLQRIDTHDATTFLADQESGITIYELGEDGLVEYEPGVDIQAMTNGIDNTYRYTFVVGNIDGGNGIQYRDNLLWVLDSNGQAINHPWIPEFNDEGDRLVSNIVPLGQLLSQLTLHAVPATGTTRASDIPDGLIYSLTRSNASVATDFEFDGGPAVDLPVGGVKDLRDGDRFLVNGGIGGQYVFEIDSGSVLVVYDGLTVRDGDTIAITGWTSADHAGQVTRTYEFTKDGSYELTNVPVRFGTSWTAEQVAQALVDAINNDDPQGGYIVEATSHQPDLLGPVRISLANDLGDAVIGSTKGLTVTGIEVEGSAGVIQENGPLGPQIIPLDFEETGSTSALLVALQTSLEARLRVDFSYAIRQDGSSRWTLYPTDALRQLDPTKFVEVAVGARGTGATIRPGIFDTGVGQTNPFDNNDFIITAKAGLEQACLGTEVQFVDGSSTLTGNQAQITYLAAQEATATINDAISTPIISLTANYYGATYNGVKVVFALGGTLNNETVTFDAPSRTLTVSIESGVSTVASIVAAINGAQDSPFTASAIAAGPTAVSVLGLVATSAGGVTGIVTIAINPGITTAQTVIDTINNDPTSSFTAALDNEVDPTNDGSGVLILNLTGSLHSGVGGLIVMTGRVGPNPEGTLRTQGFDREHGSQVGILPTSEKVVPFRAEDGANTIAARIATATNSFFSNPNIATLGPNAVVFFSKITDSQISAPLRSEGGGDSGFVTGVAVIDHELYAVTDVGSVYKVLGVRDDIDIREDGVWGFYPVDSEDYNYIEKSLVEGPSMKYLGTIQYNGAPVPFSGLSAGPTNVEGGQYADLLFATDSDGRVYALDTNGQLQPVFLDGQTSMSTGLAGARGIAFTPVDYNLWHTSNHRALDAGHGINDTFYDSRPNGFDEYPKRGQTSWYFGIDDPRLASVNDGPVMSQPGITNFYDNSDADAEVFHTYDVPGGTYGSLTSSTFSLVGYESWDKPVLYFSYFAETENTDDYDGFRVFISDDGVNWQMLATNTDWTDTYIENHLVFPGHTDRTIARIYDSGEAWRQIRTDLSDWAGKDNLRLRFDFSTASDMDVGVSNTTGEYIGAVAGTDLLSYTATTPSQFVIDGQTFQFDLGWSVVMPLSSAGRRIADGDWIQLYDGIGTALRLEFDKGNGVTSGSLAVPIAASDSSEDVSARVVQLVNSSGLLVTAFQDGPRVFLMDAWNVSVGGTSLLRQGNDPGNVLAGTVPVTVRGDLATRQVAEAVTDAVNGRFAGTSGVSMILDPVLPDFMRLVGHHMSNPGPLNRATSLPGDATDKEYLMTGNRFNNFQRGQDNAYEGAFIDDIIIGFVERGEMVTAAPAATTSWTFAPLPGAGDPPLVVTGDYQLEVRRGEDYGNHYPPPFTVRSPWTDIGMPDSFHVNDTNDRATQSFSLLTDSASQLHHGDTFTISDGVHQETFVFLDRQLGVGGGTMTPIFYQGGWSAADVALEVARVINASTNVDVSARAIDALNRVELFRATDVTGIDRIIFGSVDVTEQDLVEFPLGPVQVLAESNADALRDYILDPSIATVGGATLVGSATSAGYWTDGLNAGILLTTGSVYSAVGPNMDDGSSGLASGSGDAELTAEFGSTTLDTTSLEFQFRTTSGELYFEFVFASEEYNEWADSPFNDVFAFFLDGQNIALIPGTSIPVAINNVNYTEDDYPELYHNNDPGDGGQFLGTFGYDGFTNVFVASAVGLDPSVAHTIKLVISDVGDQILDSGVFIKAGSFSGNRPEKKDTVYLIHPDPWGNPLVGDSNLFRDKGEVIVERNTVSYSSQYGIVVAPSARDEGAAYWPHPGSGRTLSAPNDLVPGVLIENNLVVRNLGGGISFSGDSNPAGEPVGAIPFGRIVNNTISGLIGEGGGLADIVILMDVSGSMTWAIEDTKDQLSGIDAQMKAAGIDANYGLITFGNDPTDPVLLENIVDFATFTAPNSAFSQLDIDPMGGTENGSLAVREALNDAFPTTTVNFRPGARPVIILVTDEPDNSGAADYAAARTVLQSTDAVMFAIAIPGDVRYEPLATDNHGELFDIQQFQTDPAGFFNGLSVAIVGSLSGTGTGIDVTHNASPTMLNNIVANCQTGISVDSSSLAAGTVLGGTVYQGNKQDTAGIGLGTFPYVLTSEDPLFIDPDHGNFYLALGSKAIDSSVDSLEERQNYYNQILEPIGIPVSPIVSPDYDLCGQLRRDDPAIAPNPGQGFSIYKDRGAIDRVDFEGPTAWLVNPLDNDATIDRNPNLHDVVVTGQVLTEFDIQLRDPNGVGVTDATVVSDVLTIYRGEDLLIAGQDYFFQYSATNDVISLFPAVGIWPTGYDYKIFLDRTAIHDLANNPLQANRNDGTTYFTINLSGLDFGDAPDPPYPTLLANNGARHVIVNGYYLGGNVNGETDAKQNPAAGGDQYDDGVSFQSALLIDSAVPVAVQASGAGFLSAWFDFNSDGIWDDTPTSTERVLANTAITVGVNNLTITVPAGLTAGSTFARFRFSSVQGLGVTGEAPDGEVEDYQVRLVTYLEDFGDAPAPYPTLSADDGARHAISSNLSLGAVPPDADMDGHPSTAANGDDATSVDDEDGVDFEAYDAVFSPGRHVTIAVTVTGSGGYLSGWIDFNGDRIWDDSLSSNEKVAPGLWLTPGVNDVSFDVPVDAAVGKTYARFRLSTQQNLSFDGPANDGEVEDYALNIITTPLDFGDAPAPYPTVFDNNGARHVYDSSFRLGSLIDFEPDGQPNPTATGDDLAGKHDEDGVLNGDNSAFGTQSIMAGRDSTIVVNASADGGFLTAWIDFNHDHVWDDSPNSIERIFTNEAITAGANTLTFPVPRDLSTVTTFARFRFSSAQDLGVTGEAADGEVEDYQVTVVAGDAKIFGYKFNDLNANGVWDAATEPGMPNRLVELADGVDTPITTSTNDAGYYEFRSLFAGTYTVTSPPAEGWTQTLPPSGEYIVPIGAGEQLERVFGDHKMAHVAVGDASVLEGNSGTTEVHVTLHLTESFGAPVTVYYQTGNGTATTANGDYQPVTNGSFTFTPPAIAPEGVWNTQALTRNSQNDYDFSVSGNLVVYESYNGVDWDIFLYDQNTGTTRQLTINHGDDRYPAVDGTHVVWASKPDGENDFEIFVYDIQTETTTRLTNNDVDDLQPQISEPYVVWTSSEATDMEIYLYDLGTAGAPINISTNSLNDDSPQIAGSRVVWTAFDGHDNEIWLYDRATGAAAVNISDNLLDDRNPAMSDQAVAWEVYDGNDTELMAYVFGTASPVQLTNDSYNDRHAGLSGTRVVWEGSDGTDAEIFYSDLSAGTARTNLSNNFMTDERPQILGDRVVWHSFDGTNWEVYFRDLASANPAEDISQNAAYDWYPQISDSFVVWRSYQGGNYEIVMATKTEPEVVQDLTLIVYGDTTVERDEYFYVKVTGADLATLIDGNGQAQTQLQATAWILNDDGLMDYGDAPAPYPTLLAQNGARHLYDANYYLGATVDTEPDGRPSAAANGDDTYISDDEDGVVFNTPLVVGRVAEVGVTSHGSGGRLNAWIDFNGDGDWADAGEQIVDDLALADGTHILQVPVPVDAKITNTFARFRFAQEAGLSYTGTALTGEVEDYRVAIVADPNRNGRALVFNGTTGDDNFEFTAGSVYRIVVNGTTYLYPAAGIDSIQFNGGNGKDSALIQGSAETENARIWPGKARFMGTGLDLWAYAETITARSGGGDDSARMFDSTGTDRFASDPALASMVGVGFSNTAEGFRYVYANSGSGGADEAHMYDSTHNDTFVADPVNATLSGNGYYTRATQFRYVYAYSTNGGTDTATLTDSAGDDKFTATPTNATMTGAGYSLTVNQFRYVHGMAIRGGTDSAYLYDSAGNDTYYADGAQGRMYYESGFYARAKYFDNFFTYSTAGGHDLALLRGTAGKDTFYGTPTVSRLYGPGYYHRVVQYEEVQADGKGGVNTAELTDSTGRDYLEASGTSAKLTGLDIPYSILVDRFKPVTAKSSNVGDKKHVGASVDYLLATGYWEDV